MIFSTNDERITFKKEELGGYFAEIQDINENTAVLTMGEVADFSAFTASYRKRPFFMHSQTGKDIGKIPYETQFLMIKHTTGEFSVIVPLVENTSRCSLFGEENAVKIVAETGDKNINLKSARVLYFTTGADLYKELQRTSEVLSKRFGLKLRKEKAVPKIYNEFGWCTWNAFGIDISYENVIKGLESFKRAGVMPKFVILDDGWQTVNDNFDDRGNFKLKSFKPNEKFNGTLKPLISEVKNEYGVKDFYVWHAVMGYWGGIDVESEEMKKYKPFLSKGGFSEYMNKNCNYECGEYGMAEKEKIYEFYNDYHSYLKNEGVDGVKIDTQYFIEAHADGMGGRCEMNRLVHEGMERSVCDNFNNELINCMSCANDIFFALKSSNIMRTSDDFEPDKDESHGVHIYNNAINSIMYRDFTVCDWDMFQSGHKFGAYHAAARAVSGSPVYVTDEADGHDAAVLKKLVMSDGNVPMPQNTAIPAIDSMFSNPFEEDMLFKIFNYNELSGVVALFNMKEGSVISGAVSAQDICGFGEGRYAAYSYKTGRSYLLDYHEDIKTELKFGEFDIITFAKIENGMAVIGLTDFYNCGGTVGYEGGVIVKDGGTLLAYTQKKPEKILLDDEECNFEYSEGFIKAEIKHRGKIKIIKDRL